MTDEDLGALSDKVYYFLARTEVVAEQALTGTESDDLLSAICAGHTHEVGVLRDLALSFQKPSLSEMLHHDILNRQKSYVDMLREVISSLGTTRRHQAREEHRARLQADAIESQAVVAGSVVLRPSPMGCKRRGGGAPWGCRRSRLSQRSQGEASMGCG